ncbi:MAG: hypothetical protein GX811_12220 [Lentisphaerae bacterium]|nr:hypothetical protein [Lentisphaerota bacterium]
MMWKTLPEEDIGNYDALLDAIDWDKNLDPDFEKNRFMAPMPARPFEQTNPQGYFETWICFKSEDFSAKELTIQPQTTVTIKDSAAYGLILMQGYGKFGEWTVETPSIIRYGQLTADEFFVSESAAIEGVVITNNSITEPMVIIKHFGPENPDLVV